MNVEGDRQKAGIIGLSKYYFTTIIRHIYVYARQMNELVLSQSPYSKVTL